MTTIQIHLLMLVLGIIAGVCVTGSSLFRRPGTAKHLAGATKQQRTLGLLAFLVVAASPLIRFWRPSLADLALLQQAFLIAAIGLLALLLYALLQRPLARRDASFSNIEHSEESTVAIHIDADTTDFQDKTVTTDRARVSDDIAYPNSVDFFDSSINLSEAANDHARPPTPKQTDSSNLSYFANLDQLIAKNRADAEIADFDLPFINVVDDNLDLSDTDQLIADIRSQADDVELPDNEEWLADFDDSVNLDDSLVLADEHIATPADVVDPTRSIIEGELLDEEATPDANQTIPATLSETLELGKSHTLALHRHITDLNNKLNELQIIQQQLNVEQQRSQLDSAQMIINRDNLIDAEAKALEAAESVINAQRDVLDRSQQQQMQITDLLKSERSRLSIFREEAARSKSMARQATALARKAAIAHQTIRDVAQREHTARLRSQESAKKAVDIARNAITALAAEERKNASTHH